MTDLPKITAKQASFLTLMAAKPDEGRTFWGTSISAGFVGAAPVRGALKRGKLVDVQRVPLVNGAGKPVGGTAEVAGINKRGRAALAAYVAEQG